MGCIEIRSLPEKRRNAEGLIETWDVLKYVLRYQFSQFSCKFNRNMGCIEMKMCKISIFLLMRLIETWDVLKYPIYLEPVPGAVRLIETWDVLKSFAVFKILFNFCLIETWDVLKSDKGYWSCILLHV